MAQSTDTEIRELKDLILGLDKKIDVLDKKLDVSTARSEERLKALEVQVGDLKKSTDIQFSDLKKNTDTQLSDIKIQLRSQDSRLWTFIAALFLAVLGFAAKLILFPTNLA